MKKDSKQDNTELIIAMHQQIISLEKKIDILIAQPAPGPSPAPQYSNPAQRFGRSHHQGEARHDRDRRERVLHKAICADCGKECEVPFRPSQDRPVYCRECFGKRKVGGAPEANTDNRPRQEGNVRQRAPEKQKRGGMRKFGEKKMASSRKGKRSKR
jgi:CxxC-x17-CxxC domain-containing protein